LYVVTNHIKAVAFGSQISDQKRRKPQMSMGKKTFSRGPRPIWGRIFCLLEHCILVYFIFLSDSGKPKCHGAGVTYSLPPLGPLSSGLPMTDVLAVRTAKPPLRL